MTGEWIVLKFGGTSVSSAETWSSIQCILEQRIAAGHRVVLVCSAVAGVTDMLEDLADQVERGSDPSQSLRDVYAIHCVLAESLGVDGESLLAPQFRRLEAIVAMGAIAQTDANRYARRAAIVGTGELLSTRLGARWLRDRGLAASWLDVRTALEAVADDDTGSLHYLSARCDYAPDAATRAALTAPGGDVVVTQGFLARDGKGDTVLLGRGGSDTSAAYLAAKLEAARLEVWTDVPGLFTADPRQVPGARLLRRVSLTEAHALAALGAAVLHPRSLEPLRDHGVPLHLGWTSRPDTSGTRVVVREPSTPGIKSVVSRSHLALLTMRREARWQTVGFMSEVAQRFHRHGLSMDLIASSAGEIRATVDLGAFPQADETFTALIEDLRQVCQPAIRRDVASVSLVGEGAHHAVHSLDLAVGRVCGADVHLVSYAADGTHVSFVVPRRHERALVRELHATLFEPPADPDTFGTSWAELKPNAGAQPGLSVSGAWMSPAASDGDDKHNAPA